MRVTLRLVSYRYDGNNDEEIMAALNEECSLVSASPQNLIVSGMDGQTYNIPVTGYLIVGLGGWPSKALTETQYQFHYTEISAL
jgi:hypothetical protein